MHTTDPTQVAQFFHSLAATLPAPPDELPEGIALADDAAVSPFAAAKINEAATAVTRCGELANDSLTWAELPWFDVQISASELAHRAAEAGKPVPAASSFAETFDAVMRGR